MDFSLIRSNFLKKYIYLSTLIILMLISCSKGDDPQPEIPVVPPEMDDMFNKVITVKNLGDTMPAGSQPLDEQDPIYFSLENNTIINPDYRRTDRWDMSLGSTYRSFIGGNNNGDPTNLGYGGPGKGGVLCLAENFDDVIDIPDDSQFKTGSSVVGTDDAGYFGQGIGYYVYDFGGLIKGDGSFDSQHVAYSTPDTRTVVIRTARGNYAKLQIQSLYKDMLIPSEWKRNSPHTFLTFKYVLAKAGSKKFTVNN